MIKPFVGIAGVSQPRQIAFLQDEARRMGFGYDYEVMFGLFSSKKRVMSPSSAGKHSPPAEYLSSLAGLVEPPASSMVHYVTDEPDTVADQVISLFSINGLYARGCRAVQLNIEWPRPEQLELIVAAMPQMRIGLWVSRDMLDADHAALARRIGGYGGLAAYVLIDPSGGKGMRFEPEEIASAMEHISSTGNQRLIAAGGLCGQNVPHMVGGIKKRYRGRFGLDAESRLSDGKGGLDMGECRYYLSNALLSLR